MRSEAGAQPHNTIIILIRILWRVNNISGSKSAVPVKMMKMNA